MNSHMTISIRPEKRNTAWRRVAVVGATGAVGREIVRVMWERGHEIAELRLFGSEQSDGREIETQFGSLKVEAYSRSRAAECDLAFLAVSGKFAKAEGEALAELTTVIDNSSAFRYHPDIPLVVPEINPGSLGDARLIANPNCTTAILVLALEPLRRAFGLKRAIVSTYQAASGAGAAGMEELLAQTRSAALGEAPRAPRVFHHPLALNLIPQVDDFEENGYTREEMKVVWESRKILDYPEFAISCTAVRVPTLRAHAEAVTIETEAPVAVADAREVLTKASGVEVVDDPSTSSYPMPMTASDKFPVQVGRIRANPVFGDRGLDFFLCGDQLLKGAALNAVQVAELVAQRQPSSVFV